MGAPFVHKFCEGFVQEKLVRARKHMAEEKEKVGRLKRDWENYRKLLWDWEQKQEFSAVQANYQGKVTTRVRATQGEGVKLSGQMRREARFQQYRHSAEEQCYKAWFKKEKGGWAIVVQEKKVAALAKMLRVLEEDAQKQVQVLEYELVKRKEIDSALRAAGITCKCEDNTCFMSPFDA
jgi:hypothetical protein